jgi:hypothetical protein
MLSASRFFGSRWQERRSLAKKNRSQLSLEQLEARTLLSVYPLAPMQVRHAYGFDQLPLSSNDGTGQTIAIIDAYNDPNISRDLDTFDQTFGVTSGQSLYQQYGAASSFFTVHKMGRRISGSYDWGVEMSLDVQWAHSIAPGAHIMLVEAASSNLGDLLSAVNYATSQAGVVAVSMSWGSGEFSGESSYDSYFNHSGITYVASSGDTGSATEWPAVSPNVVGVGGTSLNTDSAGDYLGETGWSNSSGGAGGGVSSYESKPSYQVNVPQSSSKRTSPDVGYDADPNTGVYVYDSYYYGGGGWFQVGGTSAGAPQFAALTAIADQGRTGGSLSSADTLNTLYNQLNSSDQITATYFHDITSGGPSATPAVAGYDLSTGLGTPKAVALIPLLRGTTLAPAPLAAAVVSHTAASTSQPPTGSLPKRISPAIALAVEISSQQILGAIAGNSSSNSLATLVAPAVRVPQISPVALSTTPLPAADRPAVVSPIDSSGGGDSGVVDDDFDGVDSFGLPNVPADSKTPPRAIPTKTPRHKDDQNLPPPAEQGQEDGASAVFSPLPSIAFETGAEDSSELSAPDGEMALAFEPGAAAAGLAMVLAMTWANDKEESRRRAAL